MRLRAVVIASGLIIGLMSQAAQAALVISIVQSGADVVATGSGTLNIAGLSHITDVDFVPGIRGKDTYFGAGGQQTHVSEYIYTSVSGPFSIGTGGDLNFATSFSGDVFGFGFRDGLFLDKNFTGGALSFTDTFANQTIASLSLTTGQYVYTLPNDSFTLTIGVPAVVTTPLPASAPMFGAALLGMAGLGYVAKRKKAAAAA